MEKIIIGSDHGGFRLKELLAKYLKVKGFQVKDIGTYSEESCDYPIIAFNLARQVSNGEFKRGILLCKSGIGDAIVANKLPKVRAALCYNLKSASLSRQHNDANILVLGANFMSNALAKKITSTWLMTKFEGGRHKRRVDQIREIEKRVRMR